MPGIKPLTVPSDTLYLYDGTFDGLLCCVYESVYSRMSPCAILPAQDAPITLLPTKEIVTDTEHAQRVLASIPQKISQEALELVETVFCSCHPGKELMILRFLLRAYREGGRLLRRLGDADVAPLLSARRHLLGEAHLLKGFVRFSDYGGVLAGTITPKNFVLPFLAGHFTRRYDNEDFLLFDRTHRAALVYENKKQSIIALDSIEFPSVPPEEEKYRALWKRFYKTIAIEARENPRCRMTHMPKRYWENMLEVADLV